MKNLFIFAKSSFREKEIKFIPNSMSARGEALKDKYNLFSIYRFDKEPPLGEDSKGKNEPMRYGDLWINILYKNDPQKAITETRMLIESMMYKFNKFNPAMLRYYLNGRIGCQICIPAEMFGGEAGHPLLPLIHKELLRRIFDISNIMYIDPRINNWGMIDISHFTLGTGGFLLEENMITSDDNYRVPVSCNTFFDKSIDELLDITTQHYEEKFEIVDPERTDLHKVYKLASIIVNYWRYQNIKDLALSRCPYVDYCLLHLKDITDEQFTQLMRIIEACKVDTKLIDALMENNSESTFDQLKEKYLKASNNQLPTCEDIKKIFQCPTNCKYKLKFENKAPDANHANKIFIAKDDGIYHLNGGKDHPTEETKICGPIRTLGRIRNKAGNGWGVVLEMVDYESKTKRLTIPAEELIFADGGVKKLANLGLEISDFKKSPRLISEYINQQSAKDIYTRIEKIGWHKNVYVLPEQFFGETGDEHIYFDEHGSLFTTSGTLEEWQAHLGGYCKGNTLLMLTCQFALVGPLLTKCGMEGFGIHVHGFSASGKSTTGSVGGSVCGGDDRKGFIRQWRATSNSLECIAVKHNDNLLVIDELGQAKPEMVSETAYMLTNGQGRSRMKSSIDLREPHEWTLAYFSTGEVTIADKIVEDGKHKAMAGQEIRIINLPVDKGTGDNLFSDTHGFDSPAVLSEHLVEAAKTYWGTPLRAFLKALFGKTQEDLEVSIRDIKKNMDIFVKQVVPDGCSGQIIRTARKFGLIAAAGIFATAKGIFPWSPEEAIETAKEWFHIWLKDFGTEGNRELSKAIGALDDYIQKYGENRFISIDSKTSPTKLPYFAGYKEIDGNSSIYYFKLPIFREIVGKSNMERVLKSLVDKDRVVMDRNGNIKMFKNVYDADTSKNMNVRSIGIITTKDIDYGTDNNNVE